MKTLKIFSEKADFLIEGPCCIVNNKVCTLVCLFLGTMLRSSLALFKGRLVHFDTETAPGSNVILNVWEEGEPSFLLRKIW